MTIADIPIGSGLRLLVDVYLASVRDGVREIVARFGPPEMARRRNGVPLGVGYALTRLRRMMRLLRYVFVLLAVFHEPPPTRKGAGARGRVPHRPGPRRALFPLITPLRPSRDVDDPPRPNPFAGATRNPMVTLARHTEALSRALAAPMAHVRRLARILRRCVCYIGGRAPKRPPPTARRHFCEELENARREARFQLSEFHRRRRDSS